MDVTSMMGSMGFSKPFMGSMSSAGVRPDPGKMFNKVDGNGDGGWDSSEFQTVTDKISSLSGQNIDSEQAFADHDSDGDGLLSQEEARSFFEAHKPPGPPGGGMVPPEMMQQFMMGAMGDFTSTAFGAQQYSQISSMTESQDLVSSLMETLSNGDEEEEESEGILSSIDISV